MSKYLLLHDARGSMAEAANAQIVVGPIGGVNSTQDELLTFIKTHCNPYSADEIWFTVLDTDRAISVADAKVFLAEEYLE